MEKIQLKTPYALFVGTEGRAEYAKTAAGLVQWRPELCVGQVRLSADALDLGLPDMDIAAAKQAGVGSLVLGTATVGGVVPGEWVGTLVEAAAAGLDVVAGLHSRLSDIPELAEAAASGGRLVDVRVPPANLPVGTGKKRSGKRLLTVGTDCALGKKYTALQLERDMRAAGFNVDFRASGQTGIMIAGAGIPIDAVVADFLSGAAEVLSPASDSDHWDVIEGQGGLFHPAYAAVTHGLLVGSQPDAFVVCHQAGRIHISEFEQFEVPTIQAVIDRTVDIGKQVNSAIRCIGIAVNTADLDASEREEYLADLSKKHGLPCTDPLVYGTASLIDNMQMRY